MIAYRKQARLLCTDPEPRLSVFIKLRAALIIGAIIRRGIIGRRPIFAAPQGVAEAIPGRAGAARIAEHNIERVEGRREDRELPVSPSRPLGVGLNQDVARSGLAQIEYSIVRQSLVGRAGREHAIEQSRQAAIFCANPQRAVAVFKQSLETIALDAGCGGVVEHIECESRVEICRR